MLAALLRARRYTALAETDAYTVIETHEFEDRYFIESDCGTELPYGLKPRLVPTSATCSLAANNRMTTSSRWWSSLLRTTDVGLSWWVPSTGWASIGTCSLSSMPRKLPTHYRAAHSSRVFGPGEGHEESHQRPTTEGRLLLQIAPGLLRAASRPDSGRRCCRKVATTTCVER